MNIKRFFTIIAIMLGALFTYSFYNFAMSFVKGYSLEWSFLLYFLPVCAGTIGLIIFATSAFKKSALLRIYMCYELLSLPFTLLFYISFFKKSSELNALTSSPGWQFYARLVVDLLYLFCCAAGLWYLSKRRVPKILYYGEGENKTGQFEPAGAGLRFANRIVDIVILFFVVIKSYYSLRYWVSKDWLPESSGMVYVIELLFLIFYYLVFEGIFNTTAGKCATNTTITNDSGGVPGFGQILGRTFCRFIPFDAFSFFASGARGWHDSIPNTYVVESADIDDTAAYEITLDAEMNTQKL